MAERVGGEIIWLTGGGESNRRNRGAVGSL
jgi:hypothetical protein